MVYFPHDKAARNRCAKVMYNNASQSALCTDEDMIAAADHHVDLLANDPDPAIRAEFEEMRNSGYRFYDALNGDYDFHTVCWWADEAFQLKDCFRKVDMADETEFVKLYCKFSNSASA